MQGISPSGPNFGSRSVPNSTSWVVRAAIVSGLAMVISWSADGCGAQSSQVIVGVKPRPVPVAEFEPDGVISHLLPPEDADSGVLGFHRSPVRVAEHVALPLVLGARGGAAQKLETQEALA